MAIASGRAGTITQRDQEVLADLYWARFLCTRQIASLRFPSFESARVRLYALMRKGLLVNQVHGSGMILWRLSREGFERQRLSLDRQKEPTPDFLQSPKIDHYLEANDVYVELAPRLEYLLGTYSSWEWRNEGRSYLRYELDGRRFAHQPDAEILLPGRLYFLERQSSRARYSSAALYQKVESYRTYIERILRTEERTQVVFACDLQRERQAAVEAGQHYGVDVVASSVKGIASHIEKEAPKLS